MGSKEVQVRARRLRLDQRLSLGKTLMFEQTWESIKADVMDDLFRPIIRRSKCQGSRLQAAKSELKRQAKAAMKVVKKR